MSLKITQVRSIIKRPETQKRVMRALGLRRMHQTVEQPDTPTIRGMVAKVSHLVALEEVAEVKTAPAKKTAKKAAEAEG
ncbi:MAG: 50S ribosomal protein L30 [Rhodothermales bacterium]|nr:50S ribosomal protein L30 [Rhodothermales bacterium]